MKLVGILYRYKEPRFTSGQLRTVADIFIGTGHILFATMVIPYFISDLDKPTPFILFSGAGFATLCWITSILISKNLYE